MTVHIFFKNNFISKHEGQVVQRDNNQLSVRLKNNPNVTMTFVHQNGKMELQDAGQGVLVGTFAEEI